MSLHRRFLALDSRLSRELTLSPESDWRPVARWLAHLGDGPYIFGGLGVIYLGSWLGADPFLRRAVLSILLVLLVTLGLVTAVKYTVRRRRPRPPGEFVTFQYDAYSFPSGHSARMAALAVSTLFFYSGLGWLLVAISLGVALARVLVGVHYFSDILVGLGLGGLVAWAATLLVLYFG